MEEDVSTHQGVTTGTFKRADTQSPVRRSNQQAHVRVYEQHPDLTTDTHEAPTPAKGASQTAAVVEPEVLCLFLFQGEHPRGTAVRMERWSQLAWARLGCGV